MKISNKLSDAKHAARITADFADQVPSTMGLNASDLKDKVLSNQWSNKIADTAIAQTARRFSASEYLNQLAKEYNAVDIDALAPLMKRNALHVLSQHVLKTI